MKSGGRARLFIVFLMIAVAVVFGAAAIRHFTTQQAPVQHLSAVGVITAFPERRTVDEVLRYPGTLVSPKTVTLVPKIAGRVERITVREGELVQAGALLILLEAQAAGLQAEQALSAWNAADAQLRKAERGVRDAELESAQADLSQAEEDFSVAEKNFERSKRLYEAGTISKAAHEDAENKLNAARTQLENARRSVGMMEEGASSEDLEMARANAQAAKAVYELARLQLGYAKVTAPGPGVVAKVFVDEGNMVGTSTALMAIVQEDPMEARLQVPEKYYAHFLRASRPILVKVFPIAYPGEPPFDGAVTSVAPIIDPASRTFQVSAEIENSSGLLKPGMYVNTEIVIGREEEQLMVPDTAVVLRDDKPVVYRVVKDASAVARQVPVETGMKSGGYTSVTGEITEADEIVILGNAFLEDGQQVEVIEKR